MPDRSPVCWPEIIKKAAGQMEKKYKIKLTIDENIIFEINRMLEYNISALGYQPNVAKFAGLLAFWIRKLKPVSLSADSPNYYLASNEELALLIALALTRLYKDESGVQKKIIVQPGTLMGLARDLRYHSHTPHSLMVTFELLLDSQIETISPESPK